jgi:hypothetical protein
MITAKLTIKLSKKLLRKEKNQKEKNAAQQSSK